MPPPPCILGAPWIRDQKTEFITLSLAVQYDHPLPESFKEFPLKFEGNYATSVKIAYLKKQNVIRFFPRRMPVRTKGVTALIIKNSKTGKILKTLNIKVNNVYLQRIAKEISDLLITVDGIDVKILNNKVIIDGQVMLYQDRHRIHKVVKDYQANKAPVSSYVTMSPDSPNQTARLIEKMIGNPAITVQVIGGKYILQGTVDNEEEKNRICNLARYYTQYDEDGAAVSGGELKKRSNLDPLTCSIHVPQPPPTDEREKISAGHFAFCGAEERLQQRLPLSMDPCYWRGRDQGGYPRRKQRPPHFFGL